MSGVLAEVPLVIKYRVWKIGFGKLVWVLFNCSPFFTGILYNRSYLYDGGRI
jgi:hypothetical protein